MMETVRLLDVCKAYQPKTIAVKALSNEGRYPVYGANGIIGQHTDYNHSEEEVLMGCRGSCGAVHISQPYSWINGNAMVIQPNGNYPILKKYLYYCLLAARKDSVITGTAQPQITRRSLCNFKIQVCTPEQQQRIVSKIEELFSELDNSVAALKQTKAQLSVYRQAVLKDAFKGSHKRVPFGEIMQSNLGKMLDKKKNTGILRPYLRNANVRWHTFDLTDISEMRFEDKDLSSAQAHKGDLLICEGGEPGRCAVWEDTPPICIQKAIHRVRFTSPANPYFYAYYLQLLSQTGSLTPFYTGTGIKHLTGEKLTKIPVPHTDLEKQNSIVQHIEECLSACLSIDNTIDKTLQQTESLRQSILKQAFEGKLV